MTNEYLGWKSKWTLRKWKDPTGEIGKFLQEGGSMEEAQQQFNQIPTVEEWEDNVALQIGLQTLANLLIGSGAVATYSTATAYMGAGNSATAATSAQTGLLGTSAWVACTAGYPKWYYSQSALTWSAVFPAGTGTFAWEEYAVASGNQGSGAGVTLNRKCDSKGTKGALESWTLDLTISLG